VNYYPDASRPDNFINARGIKDGASAESTASAESAESGASAASAESTESTDKYSPPAILHISTTAQSNYKVQRNPVIINR